MQKRQQILPSRTFSASAGDRSGSPIKKLLVRRGGPPWPIPSTREALTRETSENPLDPASLNPPENIILELFTREIVSFTEPIVYGQNKFTTMSSRSRDATTACEKLKDNPNSDHALMQGGTEGLHCCRRTRSSRALEPMP